MGPLLGSLQGFPGSLHGASAGVRIGSRSGVQIVNDLAKSVSEASLRACQEPFCIIYGGRLGSDGFRLAPDLESRL